MNAANSALLTDLYQLTMLQGYYDQGMEETAVFEFFVRKLPSRRGFLLACGLEQVIEFLEGLRFTVDDIDWLAQSGRFGKDLLDALAELVEVLEEGHFLAGGLQQRKPEGR